MARPRTPDFVLARGDDVPLHRQIYDHFRTAIAAGQFRPGDRLTSARDVARQFMVARGTVDVAYAMLAGEGYTVSRGPAGTFVSPELPGLAAMRHAAKPRQDLGDGHGAAAAPLPFQLGLPALDAFPRKLWAGLVARQGRALSVVDMAYPDPAGDRSLREALAAYLAVSRGITCTASQIVITNGYQGGLGLISRTLLRRDDTIWLEDPGYRLARQPLEAAGAKLVPVRVDDEGVRVADVVARAPRARLAVVTPSHQSPLGVALSLPRRLALLSWASDARAFVVEDDYDGEFRYVGRPLPALKSLDRDDRVLYAGSLSKVLFPGLRLGYLVLPEELIPTFGRVLSWRSSSASAFEQRVVAEFMNGGHFARHLKRMRALYAARRQALTDALVAVFGDRMAIELKPGGMHLIVRLARGVKDGQVAAAAQAAGLAVEPLSGWTLKHACGPGLLLGFTNVAEQDAMSLCRRLELAIGRHLRSVR